MGSIQSKALVKKKQNNTMRDTNKFKRVRGKNKKIFLMKLTLMRT